MSNVLTLEEKKNRDQKARARTVLCGALMCALAAGVACLALLPTLISIQVARASLNAPSSDEVATARSDQEQALRTQGRVAALKSLMSATSSAPAALAMALSLQPAGISITSATYQAGRHEIVLSGNSQNREVLNSFRDELRGSGTFTGVTVPVAALVGTQGGRFTITLTGTF